MASAILARIRALREQDVADHILGFVSNELARRFMVIHEPQTFVIMDSWVWGFGAGATLALLRSQAQGEYHADGCYLCGTMVPIYYWMVTEVCFADVPGLHRLHDRLPDCEAVHDMLSDDNNFLTGEHCICRDCYQIMFAW